MGKLEEKLRAQELRKKGLSYGEILQYISVSKDTLSRWCREIPLTKKQKQRLLLNKVFGQKKASLIAADNKRRARLTRTKIIYKNAKKDLGGLSKRDRFITGIALYSGEGYKSDGKGGFTNSDPLLIKFMIRWFQEFCHIPIDKFRGAIWLHEGLDEMKAKEFWSSLTSIPKDKFHKTYFAKDKKDSKKIRKNIHKFGIFAIRFSSADKQRQIMGWISALLGGKIPHVR